MSFPSTPASAPLPSATYAGKNDPLWVVGGSQTEVIIPANLEVTGNLMADQSVTVNVDLDVVGDTVLNGGVQALTNVQSSDYVGFGVPTSVAAPFSRGLQIFPAAGMGTQAAPLNLAASLNGPTFTMLGNKLFCVFNNGSGGDLTIQNPIFATASLLSITNINTDVNGVSGLLVQGKIVNVVDATTPATTFTQVSGPVLPAPIDTAFDGVNFTNDILVLNISAFNLGVPIAIFVI